MTLPDDHTIATKIDTGLSFDRGSKWTLSLDHLCICALYLGAAHKWSTLAYYPWQMVPIFGCVAIQFDLLLYDTLLFDGVIWENI